ncbi:MAG: aspartyl protease family protein [Betaproteobacteria bacterium]
MKSFVANYPKLTMNLASLHSRLQRLIRVALAAAFALGASLAFAQNAATPRPDATAILAAAKVASGGAAWDALRTQHSKVTISAAGISGTAERWSDIYSGRSLIKYNIGPVSGAAGFDGKAAWSLDGSGQSRAETSDAARELAVNAAYRDKLAFWFPDRAAAQITFLDRVVDDGATFDVIRIVPEGGRPFQFWINTDTHLIERLVEREATETRTEYLMDLRQIEGVKIPYRVRATRGDSRRDEVITIDKLDYNWPLAGVVFAQPVGAGPDFSFAGGSATAEVPFEVREGHIFIPVMLNGKGPFRMLLDSDRGNILTPQAMAELGVKPQGNFGTTGVGENQQEIGIARVDRVEVGGVAIDGMLFAAIDVSDYLTRIVGVDGVAGVVGFEFLKRFPVKLDYQRGRATFYEPSRFTYAGGGVGVPFKLQGRVALVEGNVDGIGGTFAIDTSSADSLALNAPFVDKNGLVRRYGATQTIISGASSSDYLHALLARASTLKLGAVTVDKPTVALATSAEEAKGTGDVSGSVGYSVLRQFNITFDYANGMLYFERNANYGQRDIFDRSGMWIERTASGFEIVDVIKDGPAAKAGLAAGNVIVAVEGKPWSTLALTTVRAELKGAPGTKVKVKLASGSEKIITLRDLI